MGGHYKYPSSSLTFVPTFAGGMFEGLMANLVVPETTPGQSGRRLVLHQSMIMAALDDGLDRGALQRYFAADPESWAARLYLSTEQTSIG